MSNNNFCHIEIAADDNKKNAEFYRDLFGWKLNYDMGEDYILFSSENGIGGGFAKNTNVTRGDSVINYIEVDNLENFTSKAIELGGSEEKGKTEIPGHGCFSLIKDLGGNVFGLFSPSV